MNSARSISQSVKFLMLKTSGCNDLGFRKLKLLTKALLQTENRWNLRLKGTFKIK